MYKIFHYALIVIVSYCVPVVLWTALRKKYSVRIFPLVVGIIAYIFISFFRGAARIIILSDDLKKHVLLYYFVSALLSGVFEEIGRYVVFSRIIRNYDRRTDCIAYGIGHGAIEIFLTHNIFEHDIIDSMFDAYSFISGISFSAAMSVLIFAAVHYYSERKTLVLIAIAIHTAVDFISAFYFIGIFSVRDMIFIDSISTAVICLFSYKIYSRLTTFE